MPIVPTAKIFQNDKYHAWLESVGVFRFEVSEMRFALCPLCPQPKFFKMTSITHGWSLLECVSFRSQ